MSEKMTDPMQEWLSEYPKESTRGVQARRFKLYLEWTGKTPQQLVDEFANKKARSQILKFQNYLLNEYQAVDKHGKPKAKKGLSQNTAKGIIGAVRAFYTSQCQTVRGLKGKIVKTTLPVQKEHIFSTTDLKKMWHVADTRGKAILACATSLGWEVSAIRGMKRDFFEALVKRARSEGQDFIMFEDIRAKEGEIRLGILNPIAIDSLERWLEKTRDSPSKWLWSNGNGGRITDDTFNNIVKNLVDEANIVTIGKIRFHLIRKWLMGALTSAGLGEFETKIIMGKAIPASDRTYLQILQQTAYKKYQQAYAEHLSLVSYTNNHLRIEDIQETVERLMQDEEARKKLERSMIKVLLTVALAVESKQVSMFPFRVDKSKLELTKEEREMLLKVALGDQTEKAESESS